MKKLSSANHRRSLWALALTLGIWAPGAMAAADDMGDPVAGHKLAAAWCSNCHTLPDSKQAMATGAPSFSAIAGNSKITPLSLRVFLQTPHPPMPDLHLSNSEMDDLVSYIQSTRKK